MSHKKKYPSAAAAILSLYLFYGAGMPSAVSAQDSTATWDSVAMPVLDNFPGLSDAEPGGHEELTPYQAGVKAYLNGKDNEAITRLQEALRLDASDEKAQQLLIKILLRGINTHYEKGNYKKAHTLILDAYKYFPSNPEVKLLYSSMTESKVAVSRAEPAAPTDSAPAPRKAPSSRRAEQARLPAAQAEPQKSAQSAESSPQSPAAARPLDLPVTQKIAPAAYAAPGRNDAAYLAAIAAGPLLSTALFIFIYFRLKHEKALLLRIEALQKALVDGEVKKVEIYREMETRRNLEKQDEELAALRRSKEQRMYQELEKLKAGEESRILTELAEKRREAEQAAARELAARKAAFHATESSGSPESGAIPPAPIPEIAVRPAGSMSQENRILEILVDITPPERDAAWERISVRAAGLYETSPEAAIKFLYGLSKDTNPMNRASIIGALAAIGAPATLDIIFELYKDASTEVRREAIKHLTRLQQNLTGSIDETYSEKISACLREEKTKGDWIF